MTTQSRRGARLETPYIRINVEKCRGCWDCIEACPAGALGRIRVPFHKHAVVNAAQACTGCGECVRACAEKAIIPVKE